MKLALKLLNDLRRIICHLLLLPIGLITSPLTLLFKWNGYWILCIANQENCSLSEAKRLLKEDKKYNGVEEEYEDFFWQNENMKSFSDERRFMPIYKNLPCNIHYKTFND